MNAKKLGMFELGRVFEDYFSELQADMVENKAEDIYIYCSYEPDMYHFDVFFKINSQFIFKHNLNDVVSDTTVMGKEGYTYDSSEQRQEAVLDIGLDNLEKCMKNVKSMKEKCQQR